MYQPDIPLQQVQDEVPQQLARAKYVSIERRSSYDTVFMVDDSPFQSAMPRPTHWSIAWSDLMMTMFILFLSMFVYQTANMEFLTEKKPEVIGGDTTEALNSDVFSDNGLPFAPISPALPLMTSGTIQKVESVTLQDIDIDQVYPAGTEELIYTEAIEQEPEVIESVSVEEQIVENSRAFLVAPPPVAPTTQKDPQEIIEPRPLTAEFSGPPQNQLNDMYRLSQEALATNNLDKFASLDLVPDKTMRIILTGDLLFSPGQADLGYDSVTSLQKVAAVIKKTPYMINIVGHTDNVPMHSDRYASNWELSLARASTVARFLIEEMGMNPSQFVVSGYSSFRPLQPNINEKNRAKNRRVEIIISKRLPKPVPATAATLE
ncbi:OmpA family protein [Desulfopila sp. IMCC35008]|uniref:OmpA/MotB family protein n=1 Tax=Desulfopila sp. IMCC35008 TaxID=2653858 RepID=UPI0013D5A741|nr:OmpA family protein [Desulfopila sp. IMCC35008]